MKDSHEPDKSSFLRLKEIDTLLAGQQLVRFSLDPERVHARSFFELATLFEESDISPEVQTAIGDLLWTLASAIPEHFPENIYADYECLCGSLVTCAAAASLSAPEYMRQATELLHELLELFGQHSFIRFRYMHDFIYGFDFEQWSPPPGVRESECHDFSLSFFEAMLNKGRSMQHCAARDGAAYPRLPEGQFRNTFPFCREPASERRLFEALREENLLPIQAWRVDGANTRQRGQLYRPLRVSLASTRGITSRSESNS